MEVRMWKKNLTSLVGVLGLAFLLSSCLADGKDGANGTDGADGTNGTDGADGTNGGGTEFDYKVGDLGPAGGYIFYVDTEDRFEGFTYLEAAPSDLATTYIWSDVTDSFVGTERGLGKGKANTLAIIAQSPEADTAAKACAALAVGDFDDYFLPSMSELNKMYQNLRMEDLGGFANGDYWSSSEYEGKSTGAWNQNFYNGVQSGNDKDFTNYVRCARAF